MVVNIKITSITRLFLFRNFDIISIPIRLRKELGKKYSIVVFLCFYFFELNRLRVGVVFLFINECSMMSATTLSEVS